MIDLKETSLEGCFEVLLNPFTDARGMFIKTFQDTMFSEHGLQTSFPEHFFSTSAKNVLRGLHFQAPPKDQDKFVFCAHGAVFDVAVDLRASSPTYGQHTVFQLDAMQWNGAYIPKGFAHGFVAVTDDAVMGYLVSEEFVPDLDSGIRWDSAGIDWPLDGEPVVSSKDANLARLEDWTSPWQ